MSLVDLKRDIEDASRRYKAKAGTWPYGWDRLVYERGGVAEACWAILEEPHFKPFFYETWVKTGGDRTVTIEHIALKPEHHQHFEERHLKEARARIEELDR